MPLISISVIFTFYSKQPQSWGHPTLPMPAYSINTDEINVSLGLCLSLLIPAQLLFLSMFVFLFSNWRVVKIDFLAIFDHEQIESIHIAEIGSNNLNINILTSYKDSWFHILNDVSFSSSYSFLVGYRPFSFYFSYFGKGMLLWYFLSKLYYSTIMLGVVEFSGSDYSN